MCARHTAAAYTPRCGAAFQGGIQKVGTACGCLVFPWCRQHGECCSSLCRLCDQGTTGGLQQQVTDVSTAAVQMEAYRMSKRRDDDPLMDIEAAKAAKASGYSLV